MYQVLSIGVVLAGAALIVLGIRRNRHGRVALGIALVATFGFLWSMRPRPLEPYRTMVAAANAPGLIYDYAEPDTWAIVGKALTEAGLADCTTGRRLARTFAYEPTNESTPGADGFLAVLEKDGFTYTALGHSDALMAGLSTDITGGNTTFMATNPSTGETFYGAWTADWGTGTLYACQGP